MYVFFFSPAPSFLSVHQLFASAIHHTFLFLLNIILFHALHTTIHHPSSPDYPPPTTPPPSLCRFDSSFKRGSPATFAPNQVIKGWTEAMQLMKEGDTWELYIPSDLAYGDRGAGRSIPGGAALIFTLEMIKVKGASKTL